MEFLIEIKRLITAGNSRYGRGAWKHIIIRSTLANCRAFKRRLTRCNAGRDQPLHLYHYSDMHHTQGVHNKAQCVTG